jgi:hypothetical protein
MSDELQRRVSAALDAQGRLDADPPLRELLARDPEAAAYARDLVRLSRLLRSWPVPMPSEDAFEALALRIEQRLDEPLPRAPDPTAPPDFDDDTAKARAAPPAAASGGRFSLPSFAGAPIPKLDATAPLRRPRRGVRWIGGIAAAAAIGLGVFATTTLYRNGDSLSSAAPGAGDVGYASPSPAMAPSPALGGTVAAAEAPVPEARVAEPVASPSVSSGELWARAPAEGSTDPIVAVGARSGLGGRGATAAAPAARPRSDDVADGLAEAGRRVPRQRMRAGRFSEPAFERSTASPVAPTAGAAAARIPAPQTTPPSPSLGRFTGGGAGSGGEPRADEAADSWVARAVMPNLPAQPGRGEVLSSLQAVEPAVRACAVERHGVATVRIVVAPSGRVTVATVLGEFAGTPTGSCVARAVRGARFPPFSGERFEITYPFQL